MGETKRSGFWIRALAAVIDAALVVPAMLGGVVAGQVFAGGHSNENMERWAGIGSASVYLIYTLTEIAFAATPGKLLLGLRIHSADGREADRWRLFARWSTKQSGMICWLLFWIGGISGLRVVSGFMNFIVALGSLFASNDDKQAWHDQWCGSAVYRKKRVSVEGFAVTVVDPSRDTAQDDSDAAS